MTSTFRYQRGEPITVDLVIEDAGEIDPADVTVTMHLKKGERPPPAQSSAEPVAEFEVSYTQPAGEEAGFWRGVIAPAAAVPAGVYTTDAVLALGGTVIEVTEFVAIRVSESVTP